MKKWFVLLSITVLGLVALVGCNNNPVTYFKNGKIDENYQGLQLDDRLGKVHKLELNSDGTIKGGFPAISNVVTRKNKTGKADFKFCGWYTTRAGYTWLDKTPVVETLPSQGQKFVKGQSLFAYYEPVDSKNVRYSDLETYRSTIQSDSSLILNPTTYKWAHENNLMGNLSTALFGNEVDWEKAISQGVANSVNDFSKIIKGDYSINALDYSTILIGAAKFPYDKNNDQHLTSDGKFDRENASKIEQDTWFYELRQDTKFEDGTSVNADTYIFSLQQYLDPKQNNERASQYYKTTENRNGFPILNAEKFHSGTAAFSEVGIKKVSEYVFSLSFSEMVSQSFALSFGEFKLLHPEKYKASLGQNGTNSTYGTPDNPFISYGGYVISSWNEGQRLILNKNYNYILKDTINYKSIRYEIVADVATTMNLFKDGKLSSAGLTKLDYDEYAENKNTKGSWDGYPSYLLINLAESKNTGSDRVVHNTIMYDKRFRQALLYGFDRRYFASNIYQPNVYSIMPIPLDTKIYIQDSIPYSESAQHIDLMDELGIQESEDGKFSAYIPEKAKALFDEAYKDWKLTNNGKIIIKYLTTNDSFTQSLDNFVKDTYEKLFGINNFELQIVTKDQESVTADLKAWDYDITMTSVGFGSSNGAHTQYPMIAFLGDEVGAGALGLSMPNVLDQYAYDNSYNETIINVNLQNTYDYLVGLGSDLDDPDKYPATYQDLYLLLKASEDKPAGVYRGTLYTIANLISNEANPFDGSASEPFTGATEDAWNLIQAYERVFLEYVTMIPTVTRRSYTIYSSDVVITWPSYSTAFDWGSARYRYLRTDPDFQK